MSPLVVFVFMSLAAYRVTRFVIKDTLPPIADLRRWAVRKVGEKNPWSEGFTCPWCSGFYCCGAVWGITWYFHSLPLPGLQLLGVCTVVGLLAQLDH